MATPLPDDLKERSRINSHLDRFICLETWTPAMAAMLVSGITPTLGRTEIPDEALSLRDPSVEAHPRLIVEARKALEQWLDSEQDKIESGLSTEVPAAVDPIDFLSWAEEEYDQTPDTMKPAWLRYWLAFAGFQQYADAPLPAPTALVQRAVQLEGFAAVALSGAGSPSATPDSLPPRDEYVAKMVASIKRSRSVIAELIALALAKSDTPRNPGSVWKQLAAIAELDKPSGLKYMSPTLLHIAHKDSGWKPYTQEALTQFLARLRKRAGL
jgi:hypothetical protein